MKKSIHTHTHSPLIEEKKTWKKINLKFKENTNIFTKQEKLSNLTHTHTHSLYICYHPITHFVCRKII